MRHFARREVVKGVSERIKEQRDDPHELERIESRRELRVELREALRECSSHEGYQKSLARTIEIGLENENLWQHLEPRAFATL